MPFLAAVFLLLASVLSDTHDRYLQTTVTYKCPLLAAVCYLLEKYYHLLMVLVAAVWSGVSLLNFMFCLFNIMYIYI